MLSSHLTHGRRVGRTLFAVLALAAVAACSDDEATAPTPEPEEEVEMVAAAALQRLAISDNTLSNLKLVDVQSGTLVSTIGLRGGPASLLYRSPSGRFAIAQQRTQNVVDFIDSGIELAGSDSDPHFHKESPYLLDWNLTDQLPTHENVNGHFISVFFDGTGNASWIDERDLIAGAPRIAHSFNSGGPHHSGSATLLLAGGTPAYVFAPLNPAGGLPTSVVARNAAGQELARRDDCPVMHGNGSNADAVVFGCENGAVLFRANGTSVTATKLTMPAALAGSGVRTVWGESEATGFLVGGVATPAGITPAIRTLATINSQSGAMTVMPLPADARYYGVSIDGVRGRIAVLAHDGRLFVFNGATAQLLHTVPSVVPTIPLTGALTHTMTSAEDRVWVTSPTTGEVVEVNTASGSVSRRMTVGGTPTRVTLLGVRRNGQYELADHDH
jgi:hypothetical protein